MNIRIILSNRVFVTIILTFFFQLLLCGIAFNAYGRTFKVLVVMSYNEEYAWEKEIKEGIDSVLAENCSLQYFWMDTKRHLDRGEKKAKEAFELYQALQPDGVIAADDNAQSMFVLPYLKDKVKTPVMFCGVNGTLEDYGYPAKNVSGILERLHIRNSIIFAQQLMPSIKKMIFMQKASPSATAVFKQYESEFHTYPVEPIAHIMPKNLSEAVSKLLEYKDKSDALFIETMEGIRDDNGNILTDKEVIPILAKTYSKPLISNNLYHVEYGTLCAVIKTGEEQGATASEMLLIAMRGTPVKKIPVKQNQYGEKVLNLKVMRELGLKPSSKSLKGVTLIKTGM